MNTNIKSLFDLSYNKKIEYLNNYKELLYEIWYQKIRDLPKAQQHLEQKNSMNYFYMAFAAIAKTILRPDFDAKTAEIVDYQKTIENEIESFRYSLPHLASKCSTHSAELKKQAELILKDKDEREKHIRSLLITYRNIYISPLTHKNRMVGLKGGYKSECLLILGNSPYYKKQEYSTEIDYWFNELKDYLDPIREVKEIIAQTEDSGEHHPKYYYYFQRAIAKNKSLAQYENQFYEICEKINIWSQIFEDSKFTYRKDYKDFRMAVETHKTIFKEANIIPTELFYWVDKYTENRFEKLEAYKHGALSKTTHEILSLQKEYKSYLQSQVDEVKILPKDKLTPEFREDFLKMLELKTRYFSPEDKYQDDLNEIFDYFNSNYPIIDLQQTPEKISIPE